MPRIFRGERVAGANGQPVNEQEQPQADSAPSGPAPRSEPPGPTFRQGTPPPGLGASTSPAHPQQTVATSQEPQAPKPSSEPAKSSPEPAKSSPEPAKSSPEPGFLARGQIRRRARFLRAARELAYRDLGGLVFDLHRFGQRNDEVLEAKLSTLTRIDGELRALEEALRRRTPLTVLRQAGVSACPRCAAIHGSFDRYCPACGLGIKPDERPIAAPGQAPAVAVPSAAGPTAAGPTAAGLTAAGATPAGATPAGATAASAGLSTPASAPSAPAPPATAPTAPPRAIPPTPGTAPPPSQALPESERQARLQQPTEAFSLADPPQPQTAPTTPTSPSQSPRDTEDGGQTEVISPRPQRPQPPTEESSLGRPKTGASSGPSSGQQG